MRVCGHFLVTLAAVAVTLPAYAGVPGSVVFVTGGSAVSENTTSENLLSCERPAETERVVAEPSVNRIWQIDPDNLYDPSLDLGHIADDYSAVADLDSTFDLGSVAADVVSVPDDNMGVRLDNGWSVGFTYELLDARFKVGPFLVPEPGQPVFEGPKFVATVKFR